MNGLRLVVSVRRIKWAVPDPLSQIFARLLMTNHLATNH
jgi:hypothetical protein